MITSWLLITHCVAIFPISTYLWSWKRRRDPASIFMLLKFIYCVTFSLLYHTYDVEGIVVISDHYNNWSLLDGYSSTALIFTTTLYGLRVRPPQIYITSYAVETALLILYLFQNLWQIVTWVLILSCTIVSIFKWKTIFRYIKKYYFLSFFTLCSGITATIMYVIAVQDDNTTIIYVKHHSLWHCFIFITAGLSSILRYKLDEELYPITRREQLDSI